MLCIINTSMAFNIEFSVTQKTNAWIYKIFSIKLSFDMIGQNPAPFLLKSLL